MMIGRRELEGEGRPSGDRAAGTGFSLPSLRSTTGALVSGATALAHRAQDLADRAVVSIDLAKVRLAPRGHLSSLAETDDLDDARMLRRPALLGFLALVAVAVGASLPSSPFKLEMPGAWFFGMPSSSAPSQQGFFVGLVAVYGGLLLFMRVWYRLTRALTRRPGVPVKYLGWIMALWVIPMLIVPPLFSRDVYSYAAQGEMVSHHINPYHYGPFVLGGSPYVRPVDKLWGNTPAPYGPVFLIIDGLFASLSFHNVLGTVVLLRVLAVVGVVMIAWCVPKLARVYGKDPAAIFVLAVLNPLVVLSLVASAHNDALMLGLMLVGITLAKTGRPVWGVIFCALAAAVKAPAELAVLYVGWEWLGTSAPWRQRLRPVAAALLISAAVMVLFTLLSGLGFGWVANLETPGTVRSWLAPATGLGMLASGLGHAVGIGISQATVLSVFRVIGLGLAAGAGVYLLWRSDHFGTLKALGTSLLLFVLLGPVVQPWYLTWGLITLAVVVEGWWRRALVVLSVLSPFIGLPGGRALLEQLLHSDPLAVAAALVVLLGVLVAPLGRWTEVGPRDEPPLETLAEPA
jgi:alpha-1,6-mannosyltransferase